MNDHGRAIAIMKLLEASDMDALKVAWGNLAPAYQRDRIVAEFKDYWKGKLQPDQSDNQRNLSFKWYQEVGAQLDGFTASSARAHSKLDIGIRLLVAENEKFREQWERLIVPRFDYEAMLDLMLPPHDYPVSRIMNKTQMRNYLDAVADHWTRQGVTLTQPEREEA